MAEKEAKDLGFSFNSLSDAVNKFKNPVQALSKEVTDSIGTFNKLSSTGNAFNNDILGMKVAAANSRMSLDDLGAVVTKSGKDFAGLGGSVAKGSQVFTDFSKTFFDSGLTENLRQMGYSSKDLNEVLALQIGAQKSTTDTSVAGQIRTAQAAAALAEEMDLIAKLTGKTRKEQEEQMAKAQADGQIEAKMRLIGITQGAEAEKAARENFSKQLAQAQAMGTDQVFKEMFATGTVRSREASLQMGLLGDAARETANSAKSLSKGNVEASQAAMEAAKVGNMANQKNTALLQVAAAGVGDAGGVMKKNIEANDAAYHGMVKTQKAAEAMGVELKNTGDALKLQRQAIQDEQKARHGITAAMIAGQGRMQDINAAVANQVIKPLNEGNVAKSAQKFADSISTGVKATDTAAGRAQAYTTALANQARMGGPSAAPVGARETLEETFKKTGGAKVVQGIDKTLGSTADAFGSGLVQAKNFMAEVINVKNFNANMPSRDAGTMGKTGQPFEPNDIIAKIHKGEMVLTPEQARSFMTGAKTEGLFTAMNELSKSMPKFDMDKMPGNVDVTTSISELKKSVEGKGQPVFDIGKSMADMKKTMSGPTTAAPTKSAEPKAVPGFRMPSMDQISFGPDGMPRINPRPQAQAMAQQVSAERRSEARPAQPAQPAPAQAPAQTAQTAQAQPAAGERVATLNDVVKSLDSLNMFMGRLLSQTETNTNLVERQVRATKAIGGNVYDRLS